MRQNSALWGLAFLALVFAPGAEAIVCGAGEYLRVNSGADAVVCLTCPTGMTSAAGVVGSRGDSADPNIATAVAATVADTVLSYCNVKAGYYLATAVTATSHGTATICATDGDYAQTTSVELVITGDLASSDAAKSNQLHRCTMKSKCAADKWLKMASGDTVTCESCPAGMTSVAGSAQGTQVLLAAALGVSADKVVTHCSLKEGQWLSGAVTTTSIGAATDCGSTYHNTGAPALTIAADLASSDGALTTAIKRCTSKSKCAAGEYLQMAADNTVTCESCPAGMSSVAGSEQATQQLLAGAIDGGSIKAITYCNVQSGYYLSTATSTAVVGAATACDSTKYSATRSLAFPISSAVGAAVEAAHLEWDRCVVENDINGAAGADGAKGAAGADGAKGAAGAAGGAGAAGAAGGAGAAGNASPAAPLRTLTAAVFGAVVPAVLILV